MAVIDAPDALPSYTAAAAATAPASTTTSSGLSTEYSCSLESQKTQKPWLMLFVTSRSPSTKSQPLFAEGDTIRGRVVLDLDKAETVKGLSVSLKAGTTAVGQEEELFIDTTTDLWTPAHALPGTTSPPSSSKIKGKYEWPFAIPLPKDTQVAEKGSTGAWPLPPSFSERASPVYIDYRLVVTVKRPALKVNQTLSTSLAYLPLTRPAPPSPLRQAAYREGSELLGPEIDPEGWEVLPKIVAKGTLFEQRKVEVECELAAAKPLTYALGTPIPLTLTLTTPAPDTELLDLLSTPAALPCHLVRALALGSGAADAGTRRSNNYFTESAGRAAWWVAKDGKDEKADEEGMRRVLHGEVDVRRAVRPGFVFPRVALRYTLDLLPLTAPGLVLSLPSSHSPSNGPTPTPPLLSVPVSIVTQPAPGPAARSYAPPGYVHPQSGDYNKAMGLLENGNQRFYHRGGFQ